MAESPPTPALTPPPPPAPAPPPPPAVPSPPSSPPDEVLGENGIRALRNEREARLAAERLLDLGHSGREALEFERRRAEAAERDRDALKDRLSGEAVQAAQQAQRANVMLALAGQGVTGPKARAAIKLVEGLEFNDSFEPTNLEARLSVAKQSYGDDLFNGAAAAPPPEPAPSQHPAVHGGPRPVQPEAEEDDEFRRHFGFFFPQPQPNQPS